MQEYPLWSVVSHRLERIWNLSTVFLCCTAQFRVSVPPREGGGISAQFRASVTGEARDREIF